MEVLPVIRKENALSSGEPPNGLVTISSCKDSDRPNLSLGRENEMEIEDNNLAKKCKHHVNSSSTQKEKSILVILPDHFLCPLTRGIMEDPVDDPDGNSYDRAAITVYLQKYGKGPTGKTMGIDELRPNSDLQKEIKAWKKNPNLDTQKLNTFYNRETETVKLSVDIKFNYPEDDYLQRDSYQGQMQMQIPMQFHGEGELITFKNSSSAIFEAQAKSTAEQMPVVPKRGLVGKDGKRRRRAKPADPADPNAPKKPMTAYQAYVFGNMERVKAEEGISNVQAMSRLAELWKIMPEEDKNDYHETAKVMKNKYLQQLNAYNNGTDEPEDDEPKKGKANKGGKRK